ncbi:MAG: hypothetical protein A2X35_00425 [Elusimicrobia bacterium GWA2_61_42]|nr:MAG: hypothetical protein A2X35_00425 [Elusimicrobia bacterium GWA2_61_42]OGR79192.1 MAG: hypothetical protein A2X38_06540 [Elusimicrobia bacterium GWC2_61_25]
MKKFFSKLSVKLCIFSSALILAVIGAMSQRIMDEARNSLLLELGVRTEAFAQTSREAFTPALDIFTLHQRVSEMAKEKAISSALVFDAYGKALSHSDPEKIGEQDLSAEAARALAAGSALTQELPARDGKSYYISAPINMGKARLGTAAVLVTHQSLSAALKGARNRLLLLSAAALLIALLGTVLIVNWFTRPIPLLSRAAKAIGEGKLDAEVGWHGSDEIGLLASAFDDMAKGLRERDRIRQVFGRYVSRDVADTLLKDTVELAGERREIAVLFADIRDFSKLSLEMSPEQTVSMLNDYFSRMTQVVQTFGGSVDKFIGDGLLALFGAPVRLEGAAAKALRAAVRMRDSVEVFNAERKLKGLPQIQVGLCVTFGPAVVGTVGSEDRAEYTAIGPPVNLAARLEGLNKRLGTTIIVSREVRENLGPEFIFKELGDHPVRGWEKPVTVYALLDEQRPARTL